MSSAAPQDADPAPGGDAGWPRREPVAGVPAPGLVQCWRIVVSSLDPADLGGLSQDLDPLEHARAGRFHRFEDRRRFIAGRVGIRRLLSAALGSAPVLSSDGFGKPFCADRSVEFNISHSGDVVLVALAAGFQVGIDVERQDPISDMAATWRRNFHPGEVAELDRLDKDEALFGFLRCWTRKEAVSKALGVGLSMALDSFQVSTRAGEPPRLLTLPPDMDTRWSLRDLHPAAGYTAAFAAPVQDLTITCATLDLGNGRRGRP